MMIMYAQKVSKGLSPISGGGFEMPVFLDSLYSYDLGLFNYVKIQAKLGESNINNDSLLLYRYAFVFYFKNEHDCILYKFKYGL